MPSDFEIQATKNLHETYANLKVLGNGDLRKRLTKQIRLATLPLKVEIKASAIAELPKKGKLNQLVANSKITNSVKTGSRSAGVRITVSLPHDLRSIDRGFVKHPLFGNKKKWYTTKVKPGFIEIPVNRMRPKIQQDIAREVQTIANEINK